MIIIFQIYLIIVIIDIKWCLGSSHNTQWILQLMDQSFDLPLMNNNNSDIVLNPAYPIYVLSIISYSIIKHSTQSFILNLILNDYILFISEGL